VLTGEAVQEDFTTSELKVGLKMHASPALRIRSSFDIYFPARKAGRAWESSIHPTVDDTAGLLSG